MNQQSSKHIAEETLYEFLDNELTGTERQKVDEHLARCPACQEELAEMRSLFVEIEALPDLALDVDLSSAVLAQLGAEDEATAASTGSLWWLAAQLVVALGAGLLAWPVAKQYTSTIPTQFSLLPSQLDLAAWQQLWSQLWSQRLWVGLQEMLGWAEFFEQPLLPSYPLMWWGAAAAVATIVWLAGNGILLTTLDQRSPIQK